MREKRQRQMSLMPPEIDHPQAKELEAISCVIGGKPTICDHVMQDFSRLNPCDDRRGARGMSAEQVLRAAIVKILFGFSYQDLAFHLVDSKSIRRFCQIGIFDKGFKKSVLQKNIKAISHQSWNAINQEVLAYAGDEKIEKGRQVRIDCTVVESNIHPPSDSTLLWDTVRVLTRLLCHTKEDFGLRQLLFQDHQRRAKRRMLSIQYAKNNKARAPLYKDLLKVTNRCIGYAQRAVDMIEASGAGSLSLIALACELRRYAGLGTQVVNQTERRVLHGESVPASEKIVSVFEPHTDICYLETENSN